MAIKGKRKSKGRAPGAAPKPRLEPRRVPWFRRRSMQRGGALVLAVLGIWLGTFVWGRVSRADALERYDRRLERAQRPFTQHMQQGGSDILFTDLPRRFLQGEITAEQLRSAAERWEKDFGAAKTLVNDLQPPGSLVDANSMVANGIEQYRGIARLYVVVAQQREFARSLKGDTAGRAEAQVQLLYQHAEEWRGRADAVYRLGTTRISELKEAWGVT